MQNIQFDKDKVTFNVSYVIQKIDAALENLKNCQWHSFSDKTAKEMHHLQLLRKEIEDNRHDLTFNGCDLLKLYINHKIQDRIITEDYFSIKHPASKNDQ